MQSWSAHRVRGALVLLNVFKAANRLFVIATVDDERKRVFELDRRRLSDLALVLLFRLKHEIALAPGTWAQTYDKASKAGASLIGVSKISHFIGSYFGLEAIWQWEGN
jgi:hypothetical protein